MLANVLLVFFFVFSPRIVHVPLNTGKLVVIALALRELTIVMCSSGCISIRSEVRVHAALIATIFAISVAFYAVAGGVDFLLPYAYMINLVENLLGALLLVSLFRAKKISVERCFWILMLAFVAQATVMTISLASEQVRNFFFSINANGDVMRSIYERYQGIRGVGFSSGVTFDLSSAFFFVTVLLVYMYAECNMNAWKFFSIFGFMIIGVIISGRTGLIGLILLFPLILYLTIASKAYAKRLAYLRIVLYCSLALIAFIGALSLILPDKFKQITDFAFELFLNASSGRARTDSTDTLLHMLLTHISYDTLLFGDGRWVDAFNPNSYYKHVDVGYFRHVFYYGIFATTLSMALFVAIPMLYKRKLQEAGFLPFICCLVVFFLSVEVKGDFIWGSAMNMKLLNIALLSFLYLRDSRVEN